MTPRGNCRGRSAREVAGLDFPLEAECAEDGAGDRCAPRRVCAARELALAGGEEPGVGGLGVVFGVMTTVFLGTGVGGAVGDGVATGVAGEGLGVGDTAGGPDAIMAAGLPSG